MRQPSGWRVLFPPQAEAWGMSWSLRRRADGSPDYYRRRPRGARPPLGQRRLRAHHGRPARRAPLAGPRRPRPERPRLPPQRSYSGRKAPQHLVVVRRLARDLALPVEVVPMPTVREADGLAMSSRNAYLSPAERAAATVLWRALTLAQGMWTKSARDAEAMRARLREIIEAEALARIDYVSVADPDTLRELERIHGRALVSLAVRVGKTRLIDNVTLGE